MVYRDDLVKVTAVENSHYDTMDKSRMPEGSKSYARRFDTPDRSLVFTGDTGLSGKLEKLAAGADIHRVERHRWRDAFPQASISGVGRSAERAGRSHEGRAFSARRDWQAGHAARDQNGDPDAGRDGVNETYMRAYTGGVRRYFKGPVIMSQDLAEY